MITTQDEFDVLETEWRRLLAGRSLVMEADVDPEVAREVFAIIGRSYPWTSSTDRRSSFLKKYRATFIVGLCNTAFDYHLGGMWPFVEAALGHHLPQADQIIFSNAFRSALDTFELSRFSFPRRNVDEILMHTGIPGQRMDEFVELIARRAALTEGLDGRQFCQWLQRTSTHTATFVHKLDVPTYRFLTEGREIAEDLVDRCMEVIRVWSSRGMDAVDVTAFPRLMQHDLLRGLKELGQKRITQPRSRAREIDLYPRLIFSAFDGMQVKLPPLEVVTDETVWWTVRSDDLAVRLRVDPPWPGDPAEQSSVPLNRVARDVLVQVAPGDQTWELPLVDPNDPLLVFDGQTGLLLPPRNSLPRSAVWVAAPNPDGLPLEHLLEYDGPGLHAGIVDSPLGWGEWSFMKCDLSAVARFRLRGTTPWRYVSATMRPTIILPPAVAHATALDGEGVCGRLPRVIVPGDLSTGTENPSGGVTWRVSMRRASDRSLVFETVLTAQRSPTEVDLTDQFDRPVVGTFDLDVSGPLGRGTRRRLTIVSGLTLSSDVGFRKMLSGQDGLEPASVEVRCSPGIVTSQSSLVLGRRRSTVAVEARDMHGNSVSVSVRVPSMSVALVRAGTEGVASNTPLSIESDEVRSLAIRVRHGSGSEPPHLVAMHGNVPVQSLTPKSRRQDGVSDYNLAELADTIEQHEFLGLYVGVSGTRTQVARVRPRTIVSAVHRQGPQLVLEGLRTDESVEVGVYRRFAPWQPPTILTANQRRVPLTRDLLCEGELIVEVRIQDPWVPNRWPAETPSASENVFRITVDQLEEPRQEAEQGIRPWLAGAKPLDVTPQNLPLVMSLYSGTTLDRFDQPGPRLRQQLITAIRPVRELVPNLVEGGSVLDPSLGLIVGADIATLTPGTYRSSSRMWDFLPGIAYLTSIRSGSEALVAAEADARDRALGDVFTQFSESGSDPLAKVGRFDDTTKKLARMPRDRVDALWRVANCVPTTLLDADSRAAAAKELFDNRAEAAYDLRNGLQLLDAVCAFVQKAYGRSALTPIQGRLGDEDWTSLPAMSIAFALVARAVAHGSDGAARLHELSRPYLENLARAAPTIVQQDLVLADIWIGHWSNR
jgi:hypothetical protein